MDDSPQVRAEQVAWSAPRGRRRWRWVAPPVVAAAVALTLFTPLIVATPWSPTLRWNCQASGLVTVESFYVPTLLANAPFGGAVWANGSIGGKVGSPALAWAGSDGSAGGTFLALSVPLYHARNVTLFGPGPSHRCDVRYLVGLPGWSPAGATPIVRELLGSGNLSDAGEPASVGLPSGTLASASFDNSFHLPANGALSTCGTAGADASVGSTHRWVYVPFSLGGHLVPMRLNVPVFESFHYHFPGHGGTWSYRDLRQGHGAPGGGWAFSYTACSPSGASNARSPAAGVR